jgi:transcriptional regulator with XRE-family HTH domain
MAMLNTDRRVPSPRFGDLLRHWRQWRRLSQSDLAGEANVSARHLSFLESGRAQPSREMAALLGHVLDLPLAERNLLHVAAGFIPPHQDHGLATDDPQVREALAFILRQQEPYPALVVDGRWDVLMRNDASWRLLGPFRARYTMEPSLASNAMHVVFHPQGLRPYIANWDIFAGEMIRILHREVMQGSQPAAALYQDILRYPDLPTGWRQPASAASPVTPMRLQMDDLNLSFITTFTSFAMPADAALQQVKIECMFPADAATADAARTITR